MGELRACSQLSLTRQATWSTCTRDHVSRANARIPHWWTTAGVFIYLMNIFPVLLTWVYHCVGTRSAIENRASCNLTRLSDRVGGWERSKSVWTSPQSAAAVQAEFPLARALCKGSCHQITFKLRLKASEGGGTWGMDGRGRHKGGHHSWPWHTEEVKHGAWWTENPLMTGRQGGPWGQVTARGHVLEKGKPPKPF